MMGTESKRSSPRGTTIGLHQVCVFAGCYIITVIDVGLFLAQGPLFVIIMNKFGSNRTETALVFSVASSLALVIGIMVGPLLHKFGERRGVLCGAILSTASLVASAFAPSLNVLTVTYALMAVGFCPAFLGSITVAGKCFPIKYRGVMLAVLSTGGGVGGVFYPPLLLFLDDLYSFPGVFLILSGIVFQKAVAAMVWFPEESFQRQKGNQSKQKETPASDKNNAFNAEIFMLDNHRNESEQVNEQAYVRDSAIQCFDNPVFDYKDSSNTELEGTDCETSHNPDTDSSGKKSQFREKSFLFVLGSCESMEKNDGKQNVADDQNNVTSAHSKETVSIEVSSSLKQEETSKDDQKEESSPTVLESFKFLCKQKIFWAFTLGLSLVIPVINLFPIFIIDVFNDTGLKETQSSLGLSLLNGFGIFGRVCSGVILKIPRMFASGIPFLGAVFAGLGITGIVFAHALFPLFAFCAVYGIGQGLIIASVSVTTAELFGIKHLSNAGGILFTTSSLGGFAIGPVIGFIRDETDSYRNGLFVGVGLCAVGVVLFLFTEFWRRQNSQKKRAKSIQVSAL